MQQQIFMPGGTALETDEMRGKYLTFFTDNQQYGVPIADVLQIVGVQAITPVPEFPPYAKGVMNLRGAIIPVVDLRLRLMKPETVYDERTCIIVTNLDEKSLGLIVDEVDAVVEIPEEAISAPPKMSEYDNGYVTGVGKIGETVVLLMSLRNILGSGALL